MNFELELMVDTGASFCVLKKNVAHRLGLQFDPQKAISILPASNQPVLAPVTTITAIRIGGFVAYDLSVLLLDLSREFKVAGMLGMNFLQKFRMCIEPDTATLVLRKTK